MPPNTPICAPLSPLPSARIYWRAGSEPAPRLYRPGTINLRSSAFICGLVYARAPDINRIKFIKQNYLNSAITFKPARLLTDEANIRANPRHPRNPCSTSASFFVDAPYSKDSDRINRMDRIKPSTNPVNPVHPVQSVSPFSAAPDINCSEFIKESTSQKSRR